MACRICAGPPDVLQHSSYETGVTVRDRINPSELGLLVSKCVRGAVSVFSWTNDFQYHRNGVKYNDSCAQVGVPRAVG